MLFSDEQIEKFRRSIAQIDRGGVIDNHQVDKKFEDWRARHELANLKLIPSKGSQF